MEITEPRSTADIVQDLLDLLYNTEWVLSNYWGDHWETCNSCGNRKAQGHTATCLWVLRTKEAEAFVAVERELLNGM